MILDRYLLKQFFPIFVVAISMFMLLLVLIDLFANIFRYLSYQVPVLEILRISLYYLPKCFSYALPISLLFASAYTLGDLYARNELTSILISGIPFGRFTLSLVVLGIFASVFAFFFDDTAVIPTLALKNSLSRHYLHQEDRQASSADVVVKTRGGDLVYSVDYFDYQGLILNGISIVEQDSAGAFISLVRSPRAVWTGEYWLLSTPIIYEWEGDMLRARLLEETDIYREHPDTFRRNSVDVEELRVRDAWLLVEDLRTAGLPTIQVLANYYHRFSFPTASLVVMVLSISMGGRFKKNILLMSLLASLSAAVIFYVMEMISMMLARLGYIPPLAGAWFPVGIFIIIGLVLLGSAKT
ncbi:MAG: LptF/LptG family permease [Treponema sp.]|jgi:lipopolysaccharide export system permease protein|nr:LptF/LptG family permease [Treponema sp.]